ncbi:hypothetical protein B0H14DRAFT_2575149 [Mycena olivaceomarginata]|nr:hypothetical protein B0H14DRAFT_2575149 [Mycena olivaceomarginata]
MGQYGCRTLETKCNVELVCPLQHRKSWSNGVRQNDGVGLTKRPGVYDGKVHNLHNIFQHIAPSEGPGSKDLALFTHAPISEIVYHPMAAPIYNVNNKKICRIMNSLIDLPDPIYPEQNLKRERN